MLAPDEDLPGINVTVVSITGASGSTFQAGDTLSIRFTVKKDDGTDWDLSELDRGRTLVSGPTFNYQRVLAQQSNVLTASVQNADGSYTYTYSSPIPATYLAPENKPVGGPNAAGELTGQALLAGTYSIGLYFTRDYDIEGDGSAQDQGDAIGQFLFGGATTITPRAVVANDNCNACHENLQAHGGQRRDVTLCLLCHTAGSLDEATPGVSVEFKVMVHKIHAGEHLPSVLGVATLVGGMRDYTATKTPYVLDGFNVANFSDVGFPVWPNLTEPMPADKFYNTLTDDEKELEDIMRMGPTDCAVCHGDPDGTGPITAPAQGGLAYSQPTRRACGSCHDDVDWTIDYLANGSEMGPQADDAECFDCHDPSDSELYAATAHVHPLNDPQYFGGVNFDLTSVTDVPDMGMSDGRYVEGERIELEFTIQDDMGVDILPGDLTSISSVLTGPVQNNNLLLNTSIPTAALTGMQPYTIMLPELVQFEYVGDSTIAAEGFPAESFNTVRTPHWNVTGALTEVWVLDPAGPGMGDLTGDSFLAEAATAPQNYLDLDDVTGFARNDYVFIDDRGSEEYLKIQYVDTVANRIWFGSPASSSYPPSIRFDHDASTTVTEVELMKLAQPADFTVSDASMGEITEQTEFGDTPVLVTYTTDYLVPATYPLALNDSPDLDDRSGKWAGKSLVDGTYKLGIWGYEDVDLELFPDNLETVTSYRGISSAVTQDLLFGIDPLLTLETYDLISSGANCNSCHQDVYFHGNNRRGFDSCLLCHGAAGGEDRPQYVAAGAPATTGTGIDLRQMIHKIHMGEELANASSYTLVGFGLGYPDNYSEHTYEHVVFPTLPDAAKHCTKCHGVGNDRYVEPSDRDHPTEQIHPVTSWRLVCGSCHDGTAVQAHIGAQTDPATGEESCSVCHGTEDEGLSVELAHKTR